MKIPFLNKKPISIESIMSGFTSTMDQLDQFMADMRAEEADLRDAASRLRDLADEVEAFAGDCEAEANRAELIRSRIVDIVGPAPAGAE